MVGGAKPFISICLQLTTHWLLDTCRHWRNFRLSTMFLTIAASRPVIKAETVSHSSQCQICSRKIFLHWKEIFLAATPW